MTTLTKKALLSSLAALGDINEEQRNSVTCSLIGHSGVTTVSFGYHYCARCRDQIGDSLGGTYSSNKDVIVGHNCETCRENYKRMGWRDKLFTPDPFTEAE